MTVTPHDALDRTTRLADVVTFDDGAGLSGSSGRGRCRMSLDRAAVLAANDLAGIARESLTRTVDYDKTREQFGKPVGSFQALKHALADLHVAVDDGRARRAVRRARAGRAPAGRAAAVSVAKAKASDTRAATSTAAMIQFHGGIGYTWEHDAHLFFKRAKRLEYRTATPRTHRERIARLAVDGS